MSQPKQTMDAASKQTLVLTLMGLWAFACCVIYLSTVSGMVNIWSRSDTFTHGYLVAPISLWLAWRIRDKLLPAISQGPTLWFAALMIPCALAWLLAYLVSVQLVMQLAFVSMLVIGLATIMGLQAARLALFSLGFLFLAVPMGLGLEPPMMDLTARYTVKLIQFTGIPVYQTGRFFELPTGRWSVVEACSGVRYLIASFTLGLLYAHLNYRSLPKKLAFILASILVPIVANVIRAYLIVMLGHLSGMKLAVGVDHLIYGWIFFGFVMFILFWIGGFWADQGSLDSGQASLTTATVPARSAWLALFLSVSIACAGPTLVTAMQRSMPDGLLEEISSMEAEVGWNCESPVSGFWLPREGDADRRIGFSCVGEVPVQVFADQYLWKKQGKEIADFRSGLRGSGQRSWRVMADRKRDFYRVDTKPLSTREAMLRDGAGNEVLVAGWYLVDASPTASPLGSKVLEAMHKLQGSHVLSSRIYLAVPVGADGEAAARAMLTEFISKNSVRLNKTFSTTRSGP